jgi:hypothetical protein
MKNFEFIKRKGSIVGVGNASGVIPPFSPLKLGEKNVKLVRPVYAHTFCFNLVRSHASTAWRTTS